MGVQYVSHCLQVQATLIRVNPYAIVSEAIAFPHPLETMTDSIIDRFNQIHFHDKTMSFVVIDKETGTIVGPFDSKETAENWGENWGENYGHDWDLTVLVPAPYAEFIQRVIEVDE